MMSEVFGWFSDLARGIISILPQRRIVRAGFNGVRYGLGGSTTFLEPGVHVFWPLIHEFDDFPVCNQTSDVPKQPLMTKDGVAVTAGGVIRYRVVDPELFCVENFNAFEDIDDVAQIAIRDVVISNTLEVLQARRGAVDTKLRRSAQRRLDSYGVEVLDLNLKGLAPAQLLHVISDSHQTPVLVQKQGSE